MSDKWDIYVRSGRKIGEARRALGRIAVLLAINVVGVMALSNGMISTGMPSVIIVVLMVLLVGLVVQRISRR